MRLSTRRSLMWDRKLVQQQQVVDGGVVGLHVGAQHEAIGGEMIAGCPHRILGATVALDVGAAVRDRQVLAQHNRKSFQHQRIVGRPQVGVIAILECNP
jgi:hypothetical protein